MKVLEKDYRIETWLASAELYKTRRFYRDLLAIQDGDLPVSDDVCERIVCSIIHALLTREENEYIAAAIADAVERVAEER